jgi:hypothetical protein
VADALARGGDEKSLALQAHRCLLIYW